MNLLPAVIYPDVVNYLLFAQRPYTAEQQLWSRTITLWFSQKKLVTCVHLLVGSVISKS